MFPHKFLTQIDSGIFTNDFKEFILDVFHIDPIHLRNHPRALEFFQESCTSSSSVTLKLIKISSDVTSWVSCEMILEFEKITPIAVGKHSRRDVPEKNLWRLSCGISQNFLI